MGSMYLKKLNMDRDLQAFEGLSSHSKLRSFGESTPAPAGIAALVELMVDFEAFEAFEAVKSFGLFGFGTT